MRLNEALATELECERTGTTRYQLSLEIQRLRNHIEQTVPLLRSAAWVQDGKGRLPASCRRQLEAAGNRLHNVLSSSPFGS